MDWQVPCFYFAQASSIRPLLKIIIMIIAELRGRRRQLPSALGGGGGGLLSKPLISFFSFLFSYLLFYSYVTIYSVNIIYKCE